jgi:hypothetical protein
MKDTGKGVMETQEIESHKQLNTMLGQMKSYEGIKDHLNTEEAEQTRQMGKDGLSINTSICTAGFKSIQEANQQIYDQIKKQ